MLWYAINWLMLIITTDSVHVRTDYIACELYKVFSLITLNNALLIQLVSITFRGPWNVLDFIILVFYLITFILRIITWKNSIDVSGNRLLAVSEYFYGFIAMFLTPRAFGQVIERVRGMGAIQIALFLVIWDVMAIFWQFLAMIIAFSLAMTKIYLAEKAYTSGKDSAEDL